MFYIKDTKEGFRIYQPTPDVFEEQNELMRKNERCNNAFLKQNNIQMPKAKITGTFVYAHAPDYPSTTLHFSVKDWKEKLAALCKNGIDTVIFQAVAWHELKECYYPSKCFSNFTQWNVLDPFLEAAAELPLKVFLGEYGVVESWQKSGTPEAFAAETECHLNCLEEIYRQYRGAYHGVYFTSESWFQGERNPEREAAMNRLYQLLFSKVKELDPGLPIAISPVSFYHAGKNQNMVDFWCSVFDGAAPDILTPQDSIGTLCCTLDHQHELYSCWQQIARKLNIELWGNIELFKVEFPEPGRTQLVPAPSEYLTAQMAAAAPAVQKIICWEALHFPLPGIENK